MFLLLLTLASAQWTELRGSAPPQLVAQEEAQVPPMLSPAVYCQDSTNVYIYGGNNQMWIFEQNDRRWLWQPNPPPAMIPRNQAAHWAIRDQMYLYGGLTAGGSSLADMWLYDKSARTFTSIVPQSSVTPGACYGTSFWMHQPSNQLYLWGGTCDNKTNAEVYAFDVSLQQWHHIVPTGEGPLGATNSAAVLSRDESQVFIYTNDELWIMDLNTYTWTKSANGNSPPGPNRKYAIMWQSTTDDTIMLYGGIGGGRVFGDTWSYHPATSMWTSHGSKGPAARWGASACTNKNGYAYLFGGTNMDNTPLFNDIWQYGPFNAHTILDQIQWKLDSATIFSITSAVFGGVTFLCILFLMIISCIRKCLNRKRTRNLLGSVNGGSKVVMMGQADIDMDEDDF